MRPQHHHHHHQDEPIDPSSSDLIIKTAKEKSEWIKGHNNNRVPYCASGNNDNDCKMVTTDRTRRGYTHEEIPWQPYGNNMG